jgi:Tol biopolymer transport system component
MRKGGNLIVVPFDPPRLTVGGAAVPVVEDVMQFPLSGCAQYSLSATGSLIYVPGGVQGAQLRMVWVSRNGAEQPVAAPARAYLNPRLSPDGHRIGVTIPEQESQTWLNDLYREALTRLPFEVNANPYPVWTPDGKRIAFSSNKERPFNISWQLADSSGGLERLTTSEYPPVPNSWSPYRQLLAFIESNPTTGWDVWVLRLGDSSAVSGQVRKAQPFVQKPFTEGAPRFSPDGHWLAYISDESGHRGIYVQPYPGPRGKWQISTAGRTEAVSKRNGRELFYRSGEKMMAVDIATQSGFAPGKPGMLFEGQCQPTPVTFPTHDVSPDGQRFLMLSDSAEAVPTQINVALNWFEELKRRVPVGTK